jgi:hypothetical protein
MTLYVAARLLHVFGALGLFVTLGIEWAALSQLAETRTSDEVRRALKTLGLSRKVGPPALISTLAAGIYMTTVIDAWSLAWPRVAFGSIVLIALIGGLITGRRTAALGRSVGAETDRTFEERTADPWLWSSLLTRAAILVGIIVLMTTKPTMAGSLVTMVAAIGTGLIAGLPAWLGARRRVGTV